MLCFCRVNDGGLTRNTVSCSVHYVDVGMWASFSKSLAVLLRRTLWPVVEPGNAYSLTHHTDKSLVFFSNEPVRPYADQLQLTSFVLLQTVDGYAKRKQDKRSKFSERSSLQLCVACGCFLRCCGGVGALLWKVQIAVKQWMSDAAWHF
ncbi:hypothetical protein PC117_g10443 [Phytophthora cactorum]|uniref:Uncharacterized protein n=1 Tax=Phytophthora cactorum TaxID=29920 RepID=A0A8T1DM03_9STRA|nr:hypothetical protein PC117_g10443 [Phytophthora cactorum]